MSIATPLVSVVIPACNAAPWIRRAVDSVLAQTYRPIELIVVDDGSTDATVQQLDACRGLALVLQKPNGGQSSARNAGIRAARGEWIALLDADDEWLPNKVELQLAALRNSPECQWVYSDAYIVREHDRSRAKSIGRQMTLHAGDILEHLLLEDFIPSPTPLIAWGVFQEVGGFDESHRKRFGEDWDMWLKIARRYRIACVREPLAIYHVHAGCYSMSVDLDTRIFSKIQIIEDAVQRDAGRLEKIRARAMAKQYMTNGLHRLARGQLIKALADVWQAVRYQPGIVKTFAPVAGLELARAWKVVAGD
jgi:glycosyltransferase involved in cell wall biosynthesis